MYKLFSIAAIIVLATGIVFMAFYALGSIDPDQVLTLTDEPYSSGGFRYTGPLLNGHFYGEGELIFDDGEDYKGGFLDGHFNGNGTFNGIFHPADGQQEEYDWQLTGVFENGRLLEGTLHYPDILVTYATGLTVDSYASSSGWRYEGALDVRGQTGAGRFEYADNAIYDGTFSRGMANGAGTLTGPLGDVIYTGSFADGAFDGQGTYYSPDGWIYEGSFKNGLFDGEGAVTMDGETISGAWVAGKQVRRDG